MASVQPPRAYPPRPKTFSSSSPKTGLNLPVRRQPRRTSGGRIVHRAACARRGNQRLEVLRHLEDSLPLDPVQRERIRALVHESDQRIRREWDPVFPRIQGELRDLRRRIAAELRPEQRAKLDALLDRKANRRNDEPPPALR